MFAERRKKVTPWGFSLLRGLRLATMTVNGGADFAFVDMGIWRSGLQAETNTINGVMPKNVRIRS